MRLVNLNTVDAKQNARGAAINARMYDEHYRVTFTNAERSEAQGFAYLLEMAYYGDTFVTARKGFICVKIQGAQVRSKKAVADINAICVERGYRAKVTAQGINFEVCKKSKVVH